MYRGAVITEIQKNILQGLMFKENSFFSPFFRFENWYISEIEVVENVNVNVNWVNDLPLVIIPEENKWHDLTKSIQIKQSNDDCLNMLKEYPEVGVYRKQNNIDTYVDNNLVYVYVNNLLPEHRLMFEQFNSTINEK